MEFEIRPFNEKTIDDFKEVVRARFSDAATKLADKVMANPARSAGMDSGAIGYADGKPVCIRASIIRRVYFGGRQFLGVVGGMLAKKHGADRSLLKRVVKNSILPRSDSKLFFTNTSVAACVRLNKEAGVEGQGPGSWLCRRVVVFRPILSKWLRFAAVHPRIPKLRFSNFTLPFTEGVIDNFADGMCLRREIALNDSDLDCFWARYLSTNKGLVASRTAAEVNWAYGDRLTKNAVFISLNRQNEILGYIVASFSDQGGLIWNIIDWIALDNDLRMLEILMKAMVGYIRSNTPAIELRISGFPKYVQSIISKYATCVDAIGHNPYLFHCYDSALLDTLSKDGVDECSWFWGPYDGDMCME